MRIVANTVSAFVFRRVPAGHRFLLLKRAPSHGGFWQSVSGTLRRGERTETAAARETLEETGLKPRSVLAIDSVNVFYDGGQIHLEPCFGIEVGGGRVRLSREHVEYRWVTGGRALRLLRWPGNRAALARLMEDLRRPKRARR